MKEDETEGDERWKERKRKARIQEWKGEEREKANIAKILSPLFIIFLIYLFVIIIFLRELWRVGKEGEA